MLICGHYCSTEGFVYNVGQRCDKNIAGKNVFQMMFNAQTEGWRLAWVMGGMAGLELWNLCLTEKQSIKTNSHLSLLFPPQQKNMHGVLKNLTNLILY